MILIKDLFHDSRTRTQAPCIARQCHLFRSLKATCIHQVQSPRFSETRTRILRLNSVNPEVRPLFVLIDSELEAPANDNLETHVLFFYCCIRRRNKVIKPTMICIVLYTCFVRMREFSDELASARSNSNNMIGLPGENLPSVAQMVAATS